MSILTAVAKSWAHRTASLGLTVLGPASQQIASLAIALSAAALLSVADFGTYALAVVFIEAGVLLIYTGFHHFITVDDSAEADLLPTCLTMMLAISTGFGAVLFCLAPLLAIWFGSPDLAPLLQMLSVLQPGAALIGWCSAVLLRKGDANIYFTCLLVCNVLSVLVGVLALFLWPSVFALLWYRVARIGIGLVVFLWVVPIKPRLGFDRVLAKRAFAFARSLYAGRFLGYFGNFGADLVLAALFSTAESGLYRFANRLASAAVDLVALPIKTLAQSRFGQDVRGGGNLQNRFAGFVVFLALFGGGAVATVSVLAEAAVVQLFRPEYLAASALVGLLACRALFMAFGDLSEPLFAALKKPKNSLYYSAISTTVTLLAILLSARFGVAVMATALAVSGIISAILTAYLVAARSGLVLRPLCGPLARILVALTGYVAALRLAITAFDLAFFGGVAIALGLAVITILCAGWANVHPDLSLQRFGPIKDPIAPDVAKPGPQQRTT